MATTFLFSSRNTEMELEETREKIIKTSTELFLRDGCKRVTMDNIATQMHISKRTLYEIFATKEELLNACIYAIHQEIEKGKEKLCSQVDEPILLAIFLLRGTVETNHKYDTFIEDIQRYYPEIYNQFTSMHSSLFRQELAAALREAQQKGIIRPNADLEQIFNAIQSLMRSCHTAETQEQKKEWVKNVSETSYTFIRGLMTAEAIERYDAQEETFRHLFAGTIENENKK